MKSSFRFICATGFLAILGNIVWAGGHTWRINEVYSNCDGSVQFIEILETCGGSGEVNIGSHHVTSNTGDVQLMAIPPGSSANKRILLGTANLPSMGGPTPDYIIPANFFSLTGDLIRETGTGHMCSILSGTVPTNGTSSLNRSAACGGSGCPTTIALNSPTNFAGATGSVTATSCVDNDGDGYGSPGHPCCSAGSQLDCNDAAPGINPGTPEAACADSTDNDCDGAMDCDDSDCTATCVPTMSQWGLMVVALLVLTAGTLISRRHLYVRT